MSYAYHKMYQRKIDFHRKIEFQLQHQLSLHTEILIYVLWRWADINNCQVLLWLYTWSLMIKCANDLVSVCCWFANLMVESPYIATLAWLPYIKTYKVVAVGDLHIIEEPTIVIGRVLRSLCALRVTIPMIIYTSEDTHSLKLRT